MENDQPEEKLALANQQLIYKLNSTAYVQISVDQWANKLEQNTKKYVMAL